MGILLFKNKGRMYSFFSIHIYTYCISLLFVTIMLSIISNSCGQISYIRVPQTWVQWLKFKFKLFFHLTKITIANKSKWRRETQAIRQREQTCLTNLVTCKADLLLTRHNTSARYVCAGDEASGSLLRGGGWQGSVSFLLDDVMRRLCANITRGGHLLSFMAFSAWLCQWSPLAELRTPDWSLCGSGSAGRESSGKPEQR